LPTRCPACGRAVHETHTACQYQVEIPRRPIYRRFNVPIGQFTCCGQRIQGRHALQTSDPLGAAASQLEPDLQATIVPLNKDAGVSHGKIQRLLKMRFGIERSRGGSVQAVLRTARRCQPISQAIVRAMPRQVKGLLRDALALRDRHEAGELGDRGVAVSRGHRKTRLHRLLVWTRANAANERLAKHLAKHRDQLFPFLHRPGLDATNYRGEQALRPAVVNRKVWGGNRTEAGAEAQSILMSVLRTCAPQHREALDLISRVPCGQRPRLLFAPP